MAPVIHDRDTTEVSDVSTPSYVHTQPHLHQKQRDVLLTPPNLICSDDHTAQTKHRSLDLVRANILPAESAREAEPVGFWC